MARLPTVGGDDGSWGGVLNEYLGVEHNADGSHKTSYVPSSAEHNADGTHATSYLPLSGGTLTGDVDADDNVISQAEIKDYSETVVTADSGASYTIDLSTGNIFNLTLTTSCEFTISNAPVSGKAGSATVILTQGSGGSKTITWTNTLKYAGRTAPTLTTDAGGVDVLQLFTIDGGTTWFCFVAGADVSQEVA